jgi:hypothetical protein
MLAYEWLKEEPRVRAKLLDNDWRNLFQDMNVPVGIKQDLLSFYKLGTPYNDANLYWFDQWMLGIFTGVTSGITDKAMKGMLSHQRLCNSFYTVIQENQLMESLVNNLFFAIAAEAAGTSSIVLDELTHKEFLRMIDTFGKRGQRMSYLSLLLYAVRDVIDSSMSNDILFYAMSLDFIRTADASTIRHAMELLRDVDIPPLSARFNSLNEVQAEHDRRTDEAVKKLLKDKPDVYIYHETFLEIAKAHGFKIPANSNDFIERGAKHHNCVATYRDKHCCNTLRSANGYGTMSRLIFASAATVELWFQIAYHKIFSISIQQCKGAYNRDVPLSEELIDLCIDMTGKPVNVLFTGIKSKEA